MGANESDSNAAVRVTLVNCFQNQIWQRIGVSQVLEAICDVIVLAPIVHVDGDDRELYHVRLFWVKSWVRCDFDCNPALR